MRHVREWMGRAALAWSLISWMAVTPARADDFRDRTLKKAEASALFEEAMRLRDEAIRTKDVKKWEHACPKLEQSLKMELGLGTQYFLAECYENIGRTGTAYVLYVDAGELAAEQKLADHAAHARKQAERLKPRLVRLVVEVAEPARALPDLVVKRGDAVVGSASWGTPVPVDPGRITVLATARGKKPWQATVEATREGSTLVVSVPALEDAPPPVSSASVAPAATAPPTVPPREQGWSTNRTAGVALLGAGGVGMVAGAILGGLVPAQKGIIRDHCTLSGGTNQCDAEGGAATDAAFALANGSNVAFAVGAVAALVGGGLVLFGDDGAKKDPGKKARARAPGSAFVAPVVTTSAAGFVLQGSF